MIRWQGREVSTKGFDLFQHVVQRVVAIGPAPYTERAVMALKAQFSLIAGSAPGCHGAMPGHALLRTRRRREAQVKVADFGRELAQGPDCNAITHAVHSCHCT